MNRYNTNCDKVTTYQDSCVRGFGAVGEEGNLAYSDQVKMIVDQVQKLILADQSQDIREIVANLLFETYSLDYMIGVDAEADFNTLYNSKIAEFCKTDKDLDESQLFYSKNLGLEVYSRANMDDGTVIVSSKEQRGKDGKEYHKGQVLKSRSWVEPKFI